MKYIRIQFICFLFVLVSSSWLFAGSIEKHPNVIIILTDDQGYGDIQALNPNCSIPTPNMDRLVDEGAVFTEAHSASAYCTPSRYGLLTGRYTWRTYMRVGFPIHYSNPAPPYPTQERITIQRMFSKLNYRSGIVGKWHLVGEPNDFDFDYSFIHDGYFVKRNMFKENGLSVDYPDQLYPPPSLVHPTTGEVTTHADMLAAGDTLTNDDIGIVLPETTERAVDFIEDHVANHGDQPFFLYFCPHAMHTPYNVPSDYDGNDFTHLYDINSTYATPHNFFNFLALLDHCVGRVLDTVDEQGIANDTIIIFSSDNGSLGYAYSIQVAPDAGNGNNAPRGTVNDPNYTPTALRYAVNVDRNGYKTMSLDGGHRVPLMVRWPGKISQNIEDSTPRCLTDIFTTLADILHVPLGPEVAEDSQSFADLLLGKGSSPRGPVVHHSRYGHLSLRDGNWKLIYADGHGGGGIYNGVAVGNEALHWTTATSALQLYNMSTDVGEANDVSGAHTNRVQSMVDTLSQYWGTDGIGRSRPNTPRDTTSDYDGDGVSNASEYDDPDRDLLNPYDGAENHDKDADGISRNDEQIMGTHPYKADSDGDGLWDSAEDKNRDGQITGSETDPCNPDTDGDGYNDFAELLGCSDPTDPTSKPITSTAAMDISLSATVGIDGDATTANDNPWQVDGTPVEYFIRNNLNVPLNNSRWFLQFDLGPTASLNAVTGARLRLHQNARLHGISNLNTTNQLELRPVLGPWSETSGSLPLYGGTEVGSATIFGSHKDFGINTTSAGFFSGTPGVVGDDSGFNLSEIFLAWYRSTTENYGLRISFTEEDKTSGIAFSTSDNAETPDQNEAPKLLVEYVSHCGEQGSGGTPLIEDSDGDGIADVWEVARIGNLGTFGHETDYDGDGQTDWHEYQAGTSVFLSSDFFDIRESELTSEAATFRWHSVSGMSYQVQYVTNLNADAWNTLDPIYEVSTDIGEATIDIPDGTGQTIFFRISVLPK